MDQHLCSLHEDVIMLHTDVIMLHRRLQSWVLKVLTMHRLLPFRSLAPLIKFYHICSWMLYNFLCTCIYFFFHRIPICFIASHSKKSLKLSPNLQNKADSLPATTLFLCPRDRRSGGILFFSCLLFCHSVLLSETLYLL